MTLFTWKIPMGDQLAQWAHLPGQTGAQTESFPGYNDWARIDWNNSVRLGPNRFSGDALVAPSELRLGKKCVFMVKRHVAKIVDASWEI